MSRKKVALVKGSAIYEYIKLNYPKLTIVPTKSEYEALFMVSNKKADFTISELIRASYYIKNFKHTNLHVSGDLYYDYHLRIASRNDLPILNVIMSKTIEQISPKYIESLQLKWGYIKETNYILIKIISLFSILFFIIFLLLFFLKRHNLKLEQRVEKVIKKNEEQALMLSFQARLAQMGEAINMIAHQWRQPLSTINGLVLIMDMKLSKSIPKYRHLLDKEFNELETITSYLSHTIDDFRDFFKPEKKKVQFELQKSIEKTIRLIKPNLIYHGITLHIDSQEEIIITGYPNEIGQVMINLINNAKDALNQSNQKDIYIKLYKKENKAIIEIQDSGVGIKEDIINNIFEPYFSTKLDQHGTGLGLYISKVIIEEHMRGKLLVKNTYNGALFTIELTI